MARSAVAAVLAALALTACSSSTSGPSAPPSPVTPSAPATPAPPTSPPPVTSASAPSLPPSPPPSSSSSAPATRWQHVVVVVEENRNATSILGNPDAPYLNRLAHDGLNLTDMHAETHPSEPNYVALFSGSTHGLTDDSCPHTYRSSNLADQLRGAGYSFVGYSEHLPHPGYLGCNAYPYARRHVPWTDFGDLPASVNQPLSAMPSDYAALPTVSFVVPDVLDDMHDGTIAQGDAWLHDHLSTYATWARTHHSLLVVTWDENEGTAGNRVATFAVGDGVAAGTWTARADHYSLLRTLEDTFGLPPLGEAAAGRPITPLQ